MSFAVDELLFRCSIKYPSTSVKAILEALADADSLPSRVNIGKLLCTIVTHSRHAKWTLHYPNLLRIQIDGKNSMDCDIGSLLRHGAEIASRFRHDQVTEMHLLLALLESQADDIAAALSLVVAEHKKAYPQGTPRHQSLLAFAIAQGRADWVTESRRRIEETPYSVGRIHDRLLEYLSSRYYPYGSHQWDEFRRVNPSNDALSGEPAAIQGAYARFLDNGFEVTHEIRKDDIKAAPKN